MLLNDSYPRRSPSGQWPQILHTLGAAPRSKQLPCPGRARALFEEVTLETRGGVPGSALRPGAEGGARPRRGRARGLGGPELSCAGNSSPAVGKSPATPCARPIAEKGERPRYVQWSQGLSREGPVSRNGLFALATTSLTPNSSSPQQVRKNSPQFGNCKWSGWSSSLLSVWALGWCLVQSWPARSIPGAAWVLSSPEARLGMCGGRTPYGTSWFQLWLQGSLGNRWADQGSSMSLWIGTWMTHLIR